MKLRSLFDVNQVLEDTQNLIGDLKTVLKYYERWIDELPQEEYDALCEKYPNFEEMQNSLEDIRANVDEQDNKDEE